jgi:hypothetical protein
MLSVVALGQELSATHYRLATAPAIRSLLARKEGMALPRFEIAEAGRIGPASVSGSRQGLLAGQWRGCPVGAFDSLPCIVPGGYGPRTKGPGDSLRALLNFGRASPE